MNKKLLQQEVITVEFIQSKQHVLFVDLNL